MNRFPRTLTLLGICVVLTNPVAAETTTSPPLGNKGIEIDAPTRDFLIPIGQLTTQADRPYMVLGTVIDGAQPRWEKTKKYIKRYPTAAQCLKQEEQSKPVVDLRNIDWRGPEGFVGLEVCLFRIMTSLKSVEEMYAWFTYHGFKISPVSRYRSEFAHVGRDAYLPVKSFTAIWEIDEYYERRPNWFYSLTKFGTAYSVSVTVSLSNDDNVSKVGMTANSK